MVWTTIAHCIGPNHEVWRRIFVHTIFINYNMARNFLCFDRACHILLFLYIFSYLWLKQRSIDMVSNQPFLYSLFDEWVFVIILWLTLQLDFVLWYHTGNEKRPYLDKIIYRLIIIVDNKDKLNYKHFKFKSNKLLLIIFIFFIQREGREG